MDLRDTNTPPHTPWGATREHTDKHHGSRSHTLSRSPPAACSRLPACPSIVLSLSSSLSLSLSLSLTPRLSQLSVKGYNDKQDILLQKIIEKMATFEIDEKRFDIIKEAVSTTRGPMKSCDSCHC